MSIIIRELGDGLVLRRATVTDADAVAAFNAFVFTAAGESGDTLGVWARDLLTRPHPTMKPGDFTIVEETQTGRIVSSLCLIPQIWSYGGIPFGVGRVELVGTHPDYRRRGLVRVQMGHLHQASAAAGHMMQVITGIPWYYRQFGYEMCLDLGGGRGGYQSQVPALASGASEPYRLRPATETDIAFLKQTYDTAQQRYVVSCVRDEAIWRLELSGRSPDSHVIHEYWIVEASDGEAVGYLVLMPRLWGDMVAAIQYELKPGVSWLMVTPSVIRALWHRGQAIAAREGKACLSFGFWLSGSHPVYQAANLRLPLTRPPYAYYVRIADLPDFLRLITPVLEQRLRRSIAAGHTGELRLTFYQSGIQLTFEQGRIERIEARRPGAGWDGSAAFPNLTFLQLLLGHRSLDELRQAYADCWVEGDETQVLLEALFPKASSTVWALN